MLPLAGPAALCLAVEIACAADDNTDATTTIANKTTILSLPITRWPTAVIAIRLLRHFRCEVLACLS